MLARKRQPLEITAAYQQAAKRLLLLDYDGTLVALALMPHKAKPSPRVLACLDLLSKDPKNTVVVISGRDRSTLENWLGHLPFGLVAEHGAFNKSETGWQSAFKNHGQWKEAIKPILNSAVSIISGSQVEEKETAIVFHYRLSSDQKFAKTEAKLLAENLLPVIGSLSLEVRRDEREMVVEVKQAGIDKGQVVHEWLKRDRYDFILCAGDSTSDEEMFKVLPPDAISIKVGPDSTDARYRINDPSGFIECLANLSKAG